MVPIIRLTSAFAVAGQLYSGDFQELAARGFRSVVCNRPDGEAAGQLDTAAARVHAHAAGLAFCALPLTVLDVLDPAAAPSTRALLETLPGPVLAYCRSGTRSAMAWATATAGTAPVEYVIAVLERAGFDLPDLADDLRARAAERALETGVLALAAVA